MLREEDIVVDQTGTLIIPTSKDFQNSSVDMLFVSVFKCIYMYTEVRYIPFTLIYTSVCI